MKSIARQLQQPTPISTARAIFDWVRRHVVYAGYVADDLGAVYTLRQRRGDCTEYAYLTAALARANGIPARMVGGYVVDRDTTLRSTEQLVRGVPRRRLAIASVVSWKLLE